MGEVELKPVAALSPAQKQALNDAIVDAFSPPELTNALRYKWGILLRNYVNTQQGFYDTVAEFIAWTDRRGKTRELAALAYAERDGNDLVRQVANDLGLIRAEVAHKYEPVQAPPPKPALEAMVAKHSRLVDYDRFFSRFRALGDRVCKIETPGQLGTGFLVGADLVLTNFHVVKDLDAASAKRTVCEFDFRTGDDGAGHAKDNGSTYGRLSAEWLVAQSPYSCSDLTGVGEPEDGKLDYALVRLADKIGAAASPSGPVRGWFDLGAERPLLALRDFVVVPQHAKGKPLEVAWGSVLSFSDQSTRLRHDATTDSGSSGSPCLTVDLDIFGLHHATDPAKNPTYNQAIPLDVIARDLTKKGVI